MIKDFKPIKKDQMDHIFDKTLRPFWSKSARTIFKVLLDSDKSHMTTLDIQDKIKEFNVKLSKKEINNWLTSLQEANYVSKEEERGKPTTIKYEGRYTFDLWKITKNGQDIAKSVALFLKKYHYGNRIENNSKSKIPSFLELSYSDFKTIKTYYFISKVVSHISKTRSRYANSYQVSKKIGLNHEELLFELRKFNEKSNNKLYEISYSNVGTIQKILTYMGMRPQEVFNIEITNTGKEFVEKSLFNP
jgi:DNA-binding PadR family transcriptional regulator